MRKQLFSAFLMLLIMTVLTGVIYPLATTGLAQLFFPGQSRGSLIVRQGETVGSSLIGQSFSSPRYFHGRLSAAGNGYDATASGGSNLSQTNKTLLQRVRRETGRIRDENSLPPGTRIPSDLVTASASGLDPHITPQAAFLQVPRVAKARHLPEETVRSLVNEHLEQRQLGILGEPRVNVFMLNLALDTLSAQGR